MLVFACPLVVSIDDVVLLASLLLSLACSSFCSIEWLLHLTAFDSSYMSFLIKLCVCCLLHCSAEKAFPFLDLPEELLMDVNKA
jgi:hypothetical protein